MYFSQEVDVDIDLDVDDIYDKMDDDERREMFDLLEGEFGSVNGIVDLFEEEYKKIFYYLYGRYNSRELEIKLKAAGLLPEIF